MNITVGSTLAEVKFGDIMYIARLQVEFSIRGPCSGIFHFLFNSKFL